MKIGFGALGAAASLVTLLSASPALADPSGFVSVGAGVLDYTISFGPDEDSFDGIAAQIAASGVYMFTPVLGAQGDIVINFDRIDYDYVTVDHTALDGALHGFYREADQFLVGGFVQFGHDTYGNGEDEFEADRAYLGLEGQAFFDNATLYGQAGFQRISPEGAPFDLDGWFGSIEARYFVTPDFRIEARAGVAILSYPDDYPRMTTINLGLGAEYRLENLPVSLTANYDYSTTTYNVSVPTFDSHRFMVGAKFALGEDSLLDRDRNGASLEPVQSAFGFFPL